MIAVCGGSTRQTLTRFLVFGVLRVSSSVCVRFLCRVLSIGMVIQVRGSWHVIFFVCWPFPLLFLIFGHSFTAVL